MISKAHRFAGQNGLLYVYRKGKTIRTKYCAVKYVENKRRDSWRVAVVVSKKVAKSAPHRNRIRRRLYEQVRLTAPQLLRNHDVVITVFDQSLETAPAELIEKLIKGLLGEIAEQASRAPVNHMI